MDQAGCISCGAKKANYVCGLCQCNSCKDCAQFISEETWSYLDQVPKEIAAEVTCLQCYNNKVAPFLDQYLVEVEKAKQVHIFSKDQSKETRLLSRKEKPFKILEAKDEDEIHMRLAFKAQRAGFNAVIDVETRSKKLHNGSYVTVIWEGSGIPSQYKS